VIWILMILVALTIPPQIYFLAREMKKNIAKQEQQDQLEERKKDNDG
jgi:hypothetical protein